VNRFKYFFVVFSVFALLLSFSAIDVKAQPSPPQHPPSPPTDYPYCFQCCEGEFLVCHAQCFGDEDYAGCIDQCNDGAGECVYDCLDTNGDSCPTVVP
jgi:hypothetical protein